MASSITVIGSTGLIGKQFLESITSEEYGAVTAITRRPIPEFENKPFINQVLNDFCDLETLRPVLKTDVLVCALGTTIKSAGSQKRFYEIDHDIPLATARMAQEQGCKTYILVSSVGADSSSKIFYSRVKGELEDDLKALGFDALHILRPSMLMGDRQESRPGEFIGKLIMAPLSFLVPWKYKPIQATTVANAIKYYSRDPGKGVFIQEGRSLFNPK